MARLRFPALCLLLYGPRATDAWAPVTGSLGVNELLPTRVAGLRRLTHTTTTSSRRIGIVLHSTAAQDPVKYALFEEQQRSLIRTAKEEMEMMREGEGGELPDLESHNEIFASDTAAFEERIKELRKETKKRSKQKKKASGGMGFGGAAAKKPKTTKLAPVAPEAAELGLAQAAVLLETGVVRVNGALSRDTVATLRSAVLEERSEAEAAVAAGMTSSKRFGDLNFAANRRDVLLPLADSKCAPAVVAALTELFGPSGTLRPLYEIIVGEESVLYELASLISEPGADQQTVHADMPYQNDCALYTGFLALQDIEVDMGPTTFLPGTHTLEAHEKLQDPTAKEQFLKSAGPRLALLRAGDIGIFDSRGLHCGGWNHPDRGSTRALFYFSFTNPKVGKFESGVNMASIRPGYASVPLQLGQLCRAVAGKNLAKNPPFEDRGDGLGSEGEQLTKQREAYRRQRNAPDGSL